MGLFSDLLSQKFVKKSSGQTSDVVRSTPQDLSFAIVDFSSGDLSVKIKKVLRLAFYEALGIDSLKNIQAYGKRR